MSAVSQAVKKLDQRGFVQSYKTPDNGKEVLLKLTKEGEKAFNAHPAFHTRVEKPFTADPAKLSTEETEGIHKLVDALRRRVEPVRRLLGTRHSSGIE